MQIWFPIQLDQLHSLTDAKINAMADITAQFLTEIRDEAREARAETREDFKNVFHRLALEESSMNDLKHRLTSLDRHMAALLATVPVIN